MHQARKTGSGEKNCHPAGRPLRSNRRKNLMRVTASPGRITPGTPRYNPPFTRSNQSYRVNYVPSFLRSSLIILSLLAADFMGAAPRSTASQTAPPQSAASPDSSPAAPTDPRALYDALNALRPDGAHVYTVKDLTLRRDVVSFTFTQGKVAFLEPLGGRITGAVFSGRGHVIATPHERGERRSLAQFIGVPILDQPFSDAYIRFSDDTAAELQRQLTQEGDEPSSDPAFNAHWDPLVAGLAPTHSLRILMDWLPPAPTPSFFFFFQNGSGGAGGKS